MKLSIIKPKLLIAALLMLSACNKEEGYLQKNINEISPLQIEANVIEFNDVGSTFTRATDNDDITTFENGDRIGITILDSGGNILDNNIPYSYNNGSWVFDNTNNEDKQACYFDYKANTYIAYYPYNASANDIKTLNELKSKFIPHTDQRNIDNYRASDLLLWESTGKAFRQLDIKFKHAYSSLYLSPNFRINTGQRDVVFKTNVGHELYCLINGEKHYFNLAADGDHRLIVNYKEPITPIWFFTYNKDVLGGNIAEITLKENSRYGFSLEYDRGTYTLKDAKVGDFYCRSSDNNGYLIPSDAILTPEQQAACIGIVFKAGIDESDNIGNYDNLTSVHGYVIALEDAVSGICEWGDRNQVTQAESVGNFNESIYNGYKNTKLTIDGFSSNESWYLYAVFHAIIEYNEHVKVPKNSTNWYLPSLKQLADVYNVYGSILSSKLGTYGKQFITYYDDDGRYWSSSQKSRPDAWYIQFNNGTIDAYSKGQMWQKNCYARAILTF